MYRCEWRASLFNRQKAVTGKRSLISCCKGQVNEADCASASAFICVHSKPRSSQSSDLAGTLRAGIRQALSGTG